MVTTTMPVRAAHAAALAAGLSLLACGSKAPPEPAAPAAEPPPEQTASATAPGPAEPEPAGEPAAEAPPEPARIRADLLAAETAAFELAEPIFKQHCARCHARGGKKARAKTLEHFDMTAYPLGGHHADEITAEIRKALAIGGGKPTMPKDAPGAVQGDELSLIADWADAYDKAHAAGAHDDRGHGAAHGHAGGHEH